MRNTKHWPSFENRYGLVRKISNFLDFMVFSAICFLVFTGAFLINVVQFLNYILFHKINGDLQKRINYYLQECALEQATVTLEWYCKTRVRLFMRSKDLARTYPKRHALILGNHSHQLDFLFYLIMMQIFGTLATGKAFVKKDFKRIPVIGWVSAFGDFIFLSRNWNEDKQRIGPALDRSFRSEKPSQILIFPEGTRFTEEKHRASFEYAKQHNIPIYKHHLIPRVKGSTEILRHIRSNYSNADVAIYQCELMQRKDSVELSMAHLIGGHQMMVDIYIEEITFDRLPPADASDAEYARCLLDIFKQKDQIKDDYLNHSHLPFESYIVKKHSLSKFLRFLFINSVFSLGFIVYMLNFAMTTESLILKIIIYMFTISMYLTILLTMWKINTISKYGAKSRKEDRKIHFDGENAADQK